MLARLSRSVVAHAWLVVTVWAVAAALMLAVSTTGLWGKSLFERLGDANAQVAGSQSAEGQEIIDTLAGDAHTVSLLVTGVPVETDEQQQAVATALEPAHARLRELAGEQNVLDPFVIPGMLNEPAAQSLASTARDGFLMIVTVNPNGPEVAAPDDEAYAAALDKLVSKVKTTLREVPTALQEVSPEAHGIVSDDAEITEAINSQVETDLARGELASLPLSLLIMVLVFGGFLTAGMPIIGALCSIAGSLGVLYLLTFAGDIQAFVVNIVTVIGLGLSIDYGLLITSRHREELVRRREQQLSDTATLRMRRRRTGRRDPLIIECVEHTMTSAGRTVLFSALTVAISMVGLLLIDSPVLVSIGQAGIAVVAVAVTAALTLVPALLALAGRRLLAPTLLSRIPVLGSLQQRLGDVSGDEGMFSALARRVHAHPWIVSIACVVLLGVCALPAMHTHLLSSTTQMLPPSSQQAQYLHILTENYPAASGQDATVIIEATGSTVTDFVANDVAAVPGVSSVQATATAGDYTVAYLDLEGGTGSATAERAVEKIRDLDAPGEMWVTGQAATQVDLHTAITDGLPWVITSIIVATMVLLFLLTGSLLVPIKALLLNGLSLAASMGILTWIFQGGHGASLLGFTPAGGVEAYVVVTAMAVGFGLAMDYEVFLLARIKEYVDAGWDNDTAVERGLQRSGRVVTFAALIIVTVFLGFVAGDMLAVKEIGVALAVIVIVDATIVRMLLVPATMTLLGSWNWWAPARLRAIYERYGLAHG